MLPPLKAIGRTLIEMFGPAPASGKWDEALWGQSTWAVLGWHDVTPESMVCQIGWGADDPAGVLTAPAAGAWTIKTYDPDRKLDPSNGSSPLINALKPGKPIRVSVLDGGVQHIVRQGLIDELTYDLREKTGELRGTDLVPLIVNARLPSEIASDPALPDTLRARAKWLLEKVGLTKLVPVFDAPQQLTNPSFENGTTDWVASNSNGTISALKHESAVDGDYVGRITVTLDPGPANVGFAMKSGYYIPVIEGEQYRVSMYAKRGSAPSGRQVRITARGYDDANAQIEEKNTAFTPTSNTEMEYFEYIYTPTPGLNITKMKAVFFELNGLTGETMDFDRCEIYGPLPYDPPVGPLPEPQQGQDVSVWSLISTSAYDALYAMWMNRYGQLCFRSFGNPNDGGFTVGGDEGLPVSSIRPQTTLGNVYTAVHAHDMDAVPPDDVRYAISETAVDIYGLITLTRNKPVPSAQVWVDSVLADRAGASLQYETGTIYPRDVSELQAILDLGMVDIMHLVADDVTPPVNVATRVLGGKLTLDTGTGITAEVTGYIPGQEWEEQEEAPPVEPPEPPDVDTAPATRIYDANKDTRAARTSGGANYGSGTEGELPVGAWQGWRNRAFIGFASIPFAGVVSIERAILELDTSSQVNIGFGSSPKVTVKRVTANWSEGTLSSPGSANATVYPGPAVTGTDAKTVTVTRSENAAVSIDITGIARAWLNGAAQYGVGIFSAGEDSTAYTTEFWSRENSTSGKRPRLVIDMTVEV